MDEVAPNQNGDINISFYRWVVLLLFCLYTSINYVQFLQYSIIANVIAEYYNIDKSTVDATGLVFMISFILLFYPGNYLIEKYNLKVTAIIGCALTVMGNVIKLFSVSASGFPIAVLGQFVCGSGQVLMVSIPSKLASTWFGPDEVSTACALAVLGSQLGVAVGGVLPPLLVKTGVDTGGQLMRMLAYNAGVTLAVFVVVLIFFRAKPDLPPSLSQLTINEDNQIDDTIYKQTLILMKNENYLKLLMIFGASNGTWVSFGLLANQIYLNYFPDGGNDVGVIVLITILAGGCFGSLIFGYILDKTHQFKMISFWVHFIAALSLIPMALSLEIKSRLASFIFIPTFGFFISSTLVIGFEFSTEITYPQPAAVSCSILNGAVYVFAIISTLLYELLFNLIGYTLTYVIIFVVLLLCSMSVYFISPDLRRRQANVSN